MLNFCTLFDSNYLSFGLALYESLERHCKKFHLYIYPFDNKCCDILKMLKLKNATIIPLSDLEDKELLSVKGDRAHGEYCWTCKPSSILYAIKNYNLDSCTYLDSDLYFFSNPEFILNKIGNNSVAITPHNFYKDHDQESMSGKYCTQFITFKSNKNGMNVLNWYRDKAIEWCYNRCEDGKFGEQKYFDNIKDRFPSIYEINDSGSGVAPWNIEKFNPVIKNEKVYLIDEQLKEHDLIFYHFHALRFLDKNKIKLTEKRYKILDDVVEIIYHNYILHCNKIIDDIYVKYNIKIHGFSDRNFFDEIFFRKRKWNRKNIYHRKQFLYNVISQN